MDNTDKLYSVMAFDADGVRFFLSDFNGMNKPIDQEVAIQALEKQGQYLLHTLATAGR